jgi:hypothetical protein
LQSVSVTHATHDSPASAVAGPWFAHAFTHAATVTINTPADQNFMDAPSSLEQNDG